MKPSWRDTLRSPVAVACFVGVALLGVVLDLWSKSAAVAQLKFSAPVRFIPYLVQFEYTENHGAVFGIGQGQQAIFLIVSIAAIAFLIYLFATSASARVYQIVLGMLLAGVIGNMYDRLKFGYVRDMIHGLPGVCWPGWIVERLPHAWQPVRGQPMEVFPWIFNVADSLLCVGVAAMIVYSFISERQRKHLLESADSTRRDLAGEQS